MMIKKSAEMFLSWAYMFSLTSSYKMNTYIAILSLSPKSVHASKTRLDTLQQRLTYASICNLFLIEF